MTVVYVDDSGALHFIQASVIAARKFLHVSGGSGNLALDEKRGRRNAERRALVVVPQLDSRIAENQRPRKRLSASRRGDFFVLGA
jgi:hypothetical protein